MFWKVVSSFRFKVNNGVLDSNTATVSITVAAGTPTANGQSVNVAHNSSGKSITLTGSDPDTPGGVHGIGFDRPTNNAGGLEGGITNGEDLRITGYMKPIATLM